ncbi:sugar ABC transporter ATP-binding protein [Nocardioides sp. BYT-33-1]|uniref:sugar ABC transporter ATP-binding protein n=1 Tax=Nocardioides sp. BYT-33-1 TaxID=3416952 RepID=UPI003F533A46
MSGEVAPVLTASGMRRSFGGVHALKEAALTLRPGTATALIGPNGAGKSTLIGILSGRIRRDAGMLTIDGVPVDFHAPRDAISQGIQVIPQELVVGRGLSIAENVLMGRYRRSAGVFVDRRAMVRDAQEIVDQVGLAVDVRDDVDGLSPAQLRLMMIAKATSQTCRVLVMDEPTASLSPREVEGIASAIERLRADGVALLYVSHRLQEVVDLCQDVSVLRDGRTTHTGSLAEANVPQLVRLMGDVPTDAGVTSRTGARRSVGEAEVLLKAERLARGRVRDVDVELRSGEVVGLAGLVGSGRTEVLRMLVGADRPMQGALTWRGRVVTRPSIRSAVASGIAFLPEDRRHQAGFQELTVAENVSLPSLAKFRRLRLVVHRRREHQAVERAIADVAGPAGRLRAPMRVLSGGNQQKALLAKWMMTGPRVFAFDEPTAGIDVGAKEAIRVQIRSLAAAGAAVIVASSDNEELPGLCDRVLVMAEGRVSGQLVGDEITQSNLLDLSYSHEPATGAAVG